MDTNKAATKETSKIGISKARFREHLQPKLKEHIESYTSSLKALRETISDIYYTEIVLLNDKYIYFPWNNFLIPSERGNWYTADKDKTEVNLNTVKKHYPSMKKFTVSFPSKNQHMDIIKYLKSVNAVLNKDNFCYSKNDRLYFISLYDIRSYSETAREKHAKSSGYVLPVVNFADCFHDEVYFITNVILKHKLFPEGISEKQRYLLEDLAVLTSGKKPYCVIQTASSDSWLQLDTERMIADIMSEKTEILQSLHFDLCAIYEKMLKPKENGDIIMPAKEELLNCEKRRADIEPYEERMLTDPNRGHWDLWLDDNYNGYTVATEDSFYARDPKADINEDGVIAIDFGTKSTIVVYQSDIEHSLPMGIGDGELSKAPSSKRYENPTVMQFVNLESFINSYKEKEGRPDTKWEDLPISHTAMDKFSNSKSEEYYAFLHQIKQWAGSREKQFRIQPIKGKSIVLPPFLELNDEDINPIEIYAYYIGLYINNMRKGHGIFLDYYLSFPVTYEVKIREKIIESFKRGLKKSLPEPILNNPDIMERFRVNGNISEPEAYAACALQEYGFDPKDDEEIFYGVFDFGGGTTDFDFGLWTKSKKRRYDYKLENFGAGGDQYLGGENLLEMLAFDLFKENQDMMRQNGFTFCLAPKCTEFLGSDALLADSQEAEKNMHNLMEKLRPYWEISADKISVTALKALFDEFLVEEVNDILFYPISEKLDNLCNAVKGRELSKEEYDSVINEAKEIIDSCDLTHDFPDSDEIFCADEKSPKEITLKVQLFDKNGKPHPNVEIKTSQKHISDFFEGKIREGINNFFSALMLSYQNERVKKPTKVNILLAGNSCKSPLVKKVFEQEINNYETKIRQEIEEIGNLNLKTSEKMFELFPPLGTPAAYEKMKERGVNCDENNFEKPTGKTGVAFGLIQCRIGSSIERVTHQTTSEEIPFQFFIGYNTRKKFEIFRDEERVTRNLGKPDYNTWYKFIEADEETFYLYYTTLPECVKNDLAVEGNPAVKRIKCNIDVTDENAFVFIRAKTPHSIEYVVSSDYDINAHKLGSIVERELE